MHTTISVGTTETTIIPFQSKFVFIALYNSSATDMYLNFTGTRGSLTAANGIPLASNEKMILMDAPKWQGGLMFDPGISGLVAAGSGDIVVQAF